MKRVQRSVLGLEQKRMENTFLSHPDKWCTTRMEPSTANVTEYTRTDKQVWVFWGF